MSSYYGGGFKEWLEDSFSSGIPAVQWAAICAIMEPHRESIDAALEGFEEDEHSWRDFRNSLWYGYEAESERIAAVLAGTLRPEDVLSSRTPEQEYGRLVAGAP